MSVCLYLSWSVHIYLSIYLSVSLGSLSISVHYISINFSSLSINQSVYLSVYLSVNLSIIFLLSYLDNISLSSPLFSLSPNILQDVSTHLCWHVSSVSCKSADFDLLRFMSYRSSSISKLTSSQVSPRNRYFHSKMMETSLNTAHSRFYVMNLVNSQKWHISANKLVHLPNFSMIYFRVFLTRITDVVAIFVVDLYILGWIKSFAIFQATRQKFFLIFLMIFLASCIFMLYL